MKKTIVLLFLCFSIISINAQRNIAGVWGGKLNLGSASLSIVFHFEKQSDGSYSGTADSPDQGASGIPCDNVTIKGDSVMVKINKINCGLKALLTSDSAMNGNWEQNGMKIPLILKKGNAVSTIHHLRKSVSTKNINGIWEGKLNIGAISLRVVFHIEKQSDTLYKGTMDSPDQGVTGVQCEAVSINGDSVIVQVKVTSMLEGLLVNDSTISGNWEQGGRSLPLIVKKVKAVSKNPNRPQTPKPPFNYNSEDVEYDNVDKSIHYGATFTYPKGAGPFPTAVLITGSGQQDRDETLLGHKPFAVIADYLTKKGFAILRVDDRGMGKSTGDVAHATSADFAKDVETSLEYLRSRKEVDKKRMGMIGHSEGGFIASIVAAGNPDIYFVIMLAGPGVKGTKLLLLQQDSVMKLEGEPDNVISAHEALFKKVQDDVIRINDSAALYNKIMADFTQWKKKQSKLILDSLEVNGDENNDKIVVRAFIKAYSSPWFKYLLKLDPGPLMEKFSCKVLAMDGSRDIQVIEPIDLDAIHKALKKSKSPEFETKEIPGLNHLFQHCKKCTVEEYAEIEETFAPEALEIMGDWLDKNVANH